MSIWLIGAGPMAQDYARVLLALDQPFRVICRSQESAIAFEKATGKSVQAGGIASALGSGTAPAKAIVAVGVEQLAPIAVELIKAGTRRILLEKPGGINVEEIERVSECARLCAATVIVGYNRRYYASVDHARNVISEDGGLLSAHFEFTEWAHKIAPLAKPEGVKEHWVLANSSHVIDLAFHLCGKPRDWRFWYAGGLAWHPCSSRFAGAGLTEQDVMFSYSADWQAPGRWGLELLTASSRLTLRPMEQLKITRTGSVEVEAVELTEVLDLEFKPGLMKQMSAFLQHDDSLACTVGEQLENARIYSAIAGYTQRQ